MKMFNVRLYILAGLFIAALSFDSLPQPSTFRFSLIDHSLVSISGTTNIKKFNCISNELFPERQAVFYKSEFENFLSFEKASLNVSVSRLDCGNKEMNKDLTHILNGKQYPYIHIDLLNISWANKASVNKIPTCMKAIVRIIITNKAQLDSVFVNVTQQENQQLVVGGQLPLKLSDFGIKSPTAMLGMIKIRDRIL